MNVVTTESSQQSVTVNENGSGKRHRGQISVTVSGTYGPCNRPCVIVTSNINKDVVIAIDGVVATRVAPSPSPHIHTRTRRVNFGRPTTPPVATEQPRGTKRKAPKFQPLCFFGVGVLVSDATA